MARNEHVTSILERYRTGKVGQCMAEWMEDPTLGSYLIQGCAGSMPTFLIAGASSSVSKFHLVIASDKEEAAYIYTDLCELLPERSVFFLPDSFKKSYDFGRINRDNVQQRVEVAGKIQNELGQSKVLVSYPEALLEKIVSPQVLEENKIQITKGEKLDLDFLNEVLVEYGFSKTDFVYEPGEFAIRGGILDIFTYGNGLPYRIELFDEEIESIRVFDPESQLSKRQIATLSIVPDVQKSITENQYLCSFDVFPQDMVLWIMDNHQLRERWERGWATAVDFKASISLNNVEEEVVQFFQNDMLSSIDVLESKLEGFVSMHFRSSDARSWTDRIEVNASPQPSFNKQFKMLIDDLKLKEEEGVGVYLFTDSVRQANRLQSIFQDLRASVSMEQIPMAIHEGFVDHDLGIGLYTDHQIFQRYHRYNLRKGFDKSKALTVKFLKELRPGDYVTHIDHGVGRYSGLEKIEVNGRTQESVRIIYQGNDVLYVSINALHKISRYVGKEGTPPSLNKLGTEKWKQLKNRTKKKVKDIAGELIKLYAKRKAAPGFAFDPDNYLQHELESSFFYEDTPDQITATQAVKDDMEKEHPMDRLVCGDVGFGKTEIAIRAAFKAVLNGKQVAILVPTTILALQHHQTFSKRLMDFGASVEYVNRFRTTKEKTEISHRLQAGEIDILIGTHAILNQKMKFKDLGLLVVDEEQKFGVAAKDKLKKLAVNVDTLTLTATPIPRTLQFSLMAARDLSILRTAPPNRQPIYTEIKVFDHELIKEAIYYEIERGGQVFFVHNRVKDLADMEVLLKKLCPEIDIVTAHGQLDPKRLEEKLVGFINGEHDVLLSTNIIETGLDIPNANTMIINNAHHFGLSDLHQLRGRVGRSNRKAFCYLFCPPLSVLTPDARRRLKTIEENSDLGSGFDIAMRDLDIRGAGNLLGGEQSGFIAEIGYDAYQKILEEAIQELKETDFQDLFRDELEKRREHVRDVLIETDTTMYIPDSYVNVIQERLNLYQELDNLKDERELEGFERRLEDRFGKLPEEVKEMFEGLKMRWLAKKLGFEHLSLKGGVFRCYFIRDPQAAFYSSPHFQQLMSYVSGEGKSLGISLKQSRQSLFMTKSGIESLASARAILQSILDAVS